MTKARIIADIVGDLSANAEKAIVVNAAGTDLVYGDAGTSEFYGFNFVDTDGDGVAEDLVLTTTNGGADAVEVLATDGSDKYEESFFASRNLTFSINATTGDLEVTV